MAPPRRYNLNNSSRPSSGSANGPGTSSPSPAPAAGSTGANSTPSPASASAPGWMVASATWAFWGSLIILTSLALRWIPFNWGLMLLFAILGGGASLLLKKSKTISFFRWMAGGIILTTILSAWFFPQLPAAVESYQPGVPSPQEQVNQSPSPTPTPEVWDSTQFSDRGGILLDKPHQEVNVPENSELCVSELTNPLTKGNLQQKIFVGEEFFSSRMSQCWDIAKGNHTIRIGDTDSAEIKQYKDYNGRVPVIRPK